MRSFLRVIFNSPANDKRGYILRRYIVIVLCVFVVGLAQAQETRKLGAGDFGVDVGVSASTSTLGVVWHATDHLVLMPEVGFYTWNHAITASAGAATVNYSGYWLHGALGIYYEARLFKAAYLDIGPAFYYDTEPKYNVDLSTDTYKYTSLGGELDVVPKFLLTNNIAVYTRLGVQYFSTDVQDTTTGYEKLQTGFNVIDTTLGLIYYFR